MTMEWQILWREKRVAQVRVSTRNLSPATAAQDNVHVRAVAGSNSASYAARAVALDALAATASVAVGFGVSWLWVGPTGHALPADLLVTTVAVVAWLVALALSGSYESRVLGIGPDEIRRIVRAALWLWVATVSVFFIASARPSSALLIGSVVMATTLTVAGRLLLRQWLYARRRSGRNLVNTLLIGPKHAVESLATVLDENHLMGYRVAGVALPPGSDYPNLDDWLDRIVNEIRRADVKAVVITHSFSMDRELVASLAWRLDTPGVDLMLEPAYEQSTGPRVTYRPAPGLPLFHLDEPYLIPMQRVLKRAIDMVIAAVALLVLAPLFTVTAIVIKTTSHGPVFYTEQRIGRGGKPFRCVKFRTMVGGAHQQRHNVLGEPHHLSPSRYRADPRVTAPGKFLRRWSVDEIPQLINVLVGSMSMVGPRPIIVDELPLLSDSDHRRHLIKPGLTGLWQVSGRKELHWDERIRLDLYYVERWSLTLDILIILRTVKAVVVGRGAF